MKSVGIIGGIGPESTVMYYRSILAAYRRQVGNGSSPSILINSIDVRKVLDLLGRREHGELTRCLLDEVRRLEAAGANFGAIAANSPHIVFDQLHRESPIPLLSIVEATAEAIESAGLRRVALFGTKFTMTASFYPAELTRRGIDVVLPEISEQDFIHDKYVGELLNNVFSAETLKSILEIVGAIRRRSGIQGVILGGTELSLLIEQREHDGVSFLDTTAIHVDRIVAELLS